MMEYNNKVEEDFDCIYSFNNVEINCLVDASLATVLYREKANMKSFILAFLFF